MLISFSIVDFLPFSYSISTNVLKNFMLLGCDFLISFMIFKFPYDKSRIVCALPSMKVFATVEDFSYLKMKQRNIIVCIFNRLEQIKLCQHLYKNDFPFKGLLST